MCKFQAFQLVAPSLVALPGVSMAEDPIRLSYRASRRSHGIVLTCAGRGAGLANYGEISEISEIGGISEIREIIEIIEIVEIGEIIEICEISEISDIREIRE